MVGKEYHNVCEQLEKNQYHEKPDYKTEKSDKLLQDRTPLASRRQGIGECETFRQLAELGRDLFQDIFRLRIELCSPSCLKYGGIQITRKHESKRDVTSIGRN